MSIEVTCPACGGSIQIEEVAEVVACPLCEVHLQLDLETSEPVLVTTETDEESDNTAEATTAETASADESVTPPETAPVETAENAEGASPFAFLPGGEQKKNTDPRPTPKFDFLPGGSDDSTESEATATAEPEASDDPETTSAETTPAETAEDTEDTTAEAASAETTAETFETETEETLEEPETVAASADDQSDPPAETEAGEDEADTVAATDTDAEAAATDAESETETPAETATAEETSETESESDSESTVEEPAAEATAEPPAAEADSSEAASATEEAATTATAPSYRKEKVVSRRLFTLTLTYAIAATIMVAMLLYVKYKGDPHQLESLPDLKPPIKNDEIALQLVPENAQLPPGHTLQLGGPGRRFGNVMVTPLRVTRGPLEFEHYTGDASRTREATAGDVLKLYLKFENMSDDQTFEPLDQKLLLSRVPGKTADSPLRANNFVSRLAEQKKGGERVLLYDMPPSWEWNIKGQNINRENTPQKLAPGESFETFVATNEAGIDSLTGELVWRLQIRKGYNPKSHRGVTTLIDVVFNSDQIQNDIPAESKPDLPTS